MLVGLEPHARDRVLNPGLCRLLPVSITGEQGGILRCSQLLRSLPAPGSASPPPAPSLRLSPACALPACLSACREMAVALHPDKCKHPEAKEAFQVRLRPCTPCCLCYLLAGPLPAGRALLPMCMLHEAAASFLALCPPAVLQRLVKAYQNLSKYAA